MKKSKILLVGCGMMGGALKRGWEQTKAPFEIVVIDPSRPEYLSDVQYLSADYVPDVILFAVKPQAILKILPLYQNFVNQDCLFLSIAAGIKLEQYYKILGQKACVIRVMPNLPVTVGQGMSVLVSDSQLSSQYRVLGQSLFDVSGKVVWLDDEKLMDVVIAISGSGPAYFFRFIECLKAAGIGEGLPEDIAASVARQTAVGVGSMLKHLSEAPEDLRFQVTSPGGTTAAALHVFNDQDALLKLTTKAVKAAIQRGEELSS